MDKLTVLKVVLVGASFSGKSMLSNRMVNREPYSDSYIGTIGVDFKIKSIHHKGKRLHIWDLGGQPRFEFLTRTYIKDCKLAILFYSVVDKDSFYNIKSLYNKYTDAGYMNGKSIIVVANKVDLDNKFNRWEEDGKEWAASINAPFVKTSGKTGQNVEYLENLICDHPTFEIIEKEEVSTEMSCMTDRKAWIWNICNLL